MIDVQELAQGLKFQAPIPEFEAVRGRVDHFLSQGEVDKARLELEAYREVADHTRGAEENSWLYLNLGKVYQAVGKTEQAIEMLKLAFDIEPRDQEAARRLTELLAEEDRYEEGLKVARILLLNQKRALPDIEVAAIYGQIGLLYEGQEAFEQARTAFEKALVKEPENTLALTGLLRAVGEIGKPGDVVDARRKLIRSLGDEKARSAALVALGNDWIEKFNDPGRALDTFEEALSEWSQNVTALQRIADVAAEMNDWRRVSRAYFTLSVMMEAPDQKAEYLIRSSDVAKNKLWEPEKALAGYRRALELDSTRLDAFKAVTSILVDARDWENLEQAYLQIIATNQEKPDTDPRLLAVLWERLGDLYSEYLERQDDAIFAYSQALEFAPGARNLREQIVALAEEQPEHLETAAVQLRALLVEEPGENQWLDRLGRVYLRQKEVDRAYCLFRALQARGASLDEGAQGFLQRFETKVVRPVKGQINPSMMARYIFAPGLKREFNDTFTILKIGLEEWTGESRRKYGLRRRDRVRLDEPLAFVNFYRNVGAALGYMELPEIWRKSDQRGLINGALTPRGFIVGDDLLGSAREKHIAFIVAKQLFLFLEPFYLATIRPLTDLQGFFIRAVTLVKPEMSDLAESFAKDTAFRAMKKEIRGDHLSQLEQLVTKLTKDTTEVVLGPWVEAIEDSANRVGLLFCDDLRVVEECLRQEPRSISQRSVQSRMEALIEFSVSEEYFTLRSELGIQVA